MISKRELLLSECKNKGENLTSGRSVTPIMIFYKDEHVATFKSVYAAIKKLEKLKLTTPTIFSVLKRVDAGPVKLLNRLPNWTIYHAGDNPIWESPKLDDYLNKATEY